MSDEDEILDDLLGQLKDNNAFNNQALKSNKDFKLPKEICLQKRPFQYHSQGLRKFSS